MSDLSHLTVDELFDRLTGRDRTEEVLDHWALFTRGRLTLAMETEDWPLTDAERNEARQAMAAGRAYLEAAGLLPPLKLPKEHP